MRNDHVASQLADFPAKSVRPLLFKQEQHEYLRIYYFLT